MWACWVLLWLSFIMDSCAVKVDSMQVNHGSQLSFRLLKDTESVDFSSTDDNNQFLIWPSSRKPQKAYVTGKGNDRRFIINSATFEDQGNYTQMNYLKRVIAVVKVKVVPSRIETECVAGDTLKISLKGLRSDRATLKFYTGNLTLVDHGVPVAKNHTDYYERLKVTTDYIQVLNVNVSDVGNYTLRDHRGRLVFIVRMKLIDRHEKRFSPLVALMLLLGIPVGVCYCCRKSIFKKNSQPTTTTVAQAGNLVPPPGPPPSYNTVVVPTVPGSVNTPAYPAPGESKVYPPPNPVFPPQPYYGGQPAMPPNPGINSEYGSQNPLYPAAPGFPPTQPSPWNAASYTPPAPAMNTPAYPAPGESTVYPPNPAFPPQPYYGGQPAMPTNPGLAPVMFHAPPGPASVTGEINMNEISPATPLLTLSQPEVTQPPGSSTGADVLNSDSTPRFNVNTGMNTDSNFL